MLWAGVAESAPLHAVQASIGETLRLCGLATDARPYVPHVTLARLAPAVPRGWVAAFLEARRSLSSTGIPVDGFQLFSSNRRDGRTEHVIEESFPLS